MADGRRSIRARLVARGYQHPDLQEGVVDTSWCVSLRLSHLQVISLCAIKKWKLRSLDITNAFSQKGGVTRDVLLQGPAEWGPVWRLKAPAFGFNDAPAAFRRSLKKHILNSNESMKRVGPRCKVSTYVSLLLFIFWEAGTARARSPLTLMIFLGAAKQMFCPRFEIF